MKHIIQFSGGLASAEVAKIIIDMYGKENVILMNHDVKIEHPDTKKFKEDVCNYLGVEYVEVSDGRDLWDLIVDQKCLPSLWIPFCTRILKQKQGLKFCKSLKDKFILYNGFGVHEGRRTSGSIRECSKRGMIVKSPLQEYNIPDIEVMRMIRDEWKIQIPEPYLNGFEHNNCLPCFKGGKAHFKRVWQFYPGSFEKAKWAEEKIGHTVFKLKKRTGRVIYKDGEKIHETMTIKQPLSELEKRWAEQPRIQPDMAKFNHADLWHQMDLFQEVAA